MKLTKSLFIYSFSHQFLLSIGGGEAAVFSEMTGSEKNRAAFAEDNKKSFYITDSFRNN